MKCSACSSEVESNAKFCKYCGTPLEGGTNAGKSIIQGTTPPIHKNSKTSEKTLGPGQIRAIIYVVLFALFGLWANMVRENAVNDFNAARIAASQDYYGAMMFSANRKALVDKATEGLMLPTLLAVGVLIAALIDFLRTSEKKKLVSKK